MGFTGQVVFQQEQHDSGVALDLGQTEAGNYFYYPDNAGPD